MQFDVESILLSPNNAVISPQYASCEQYRVVRENGFTVLPDGKTVIAVNHKNEQFLMAENFADVKSPVIVGKHDHLILTVALNRDCGLILVGDSSGRVVQYAITNGIWRIQQVYGDIGVGEVWSSARVNHLVIFGGNTGRFRVIDSRNRRVIKQPVLTAVKCIYSLSICRRRESVMLAVSGRSYDFSGDKSDLFDLSRLVEKNAEGQPARGSGQYAGKAVR